jgi:diguanylate cyclase (GGDEF)-like protein/PAS domain S-box-containing protein
VAEVAEELPVFGDQRFRAHELLRFYEDSAGDVTAIFSSGGLFVYVSPACRTTLGWDPLELVGRSIVDFVHPEDLPSFTAGRRAALRSPTVCVATYRFRRSDGGYLWTESVLRHVSDPRPRGEILLKASIRDVSDRKLVEVELQRQALTDPLTGIANRTVFMDRLDQALRRLQRSDTMVAVIYLDLDRFKVINDSLGHDLGDRLLMKVAERAVATIRPADTMARIGGDEFVILAEGLPAVEDARQLAARVCERMELPFDLDGESIVCTISAGVATTADAEHSALALLQEADLALYKAKDGGRNRAEVFDEQLRTTALGRLAVERMIRSAIGEDRLRVNYQPIIDLATGQVVRVEALVRLQGPGGLILPDDFIEVAEETGLLVTIDDYVLAEAVEKAAGWARELAGTRFGGVAVNLTGRHLSNARFVPVVADALADTGLPPGWLAIEVTERVLMEASASAMERLRSLRAMGVPIGLDDFGTGHSSLAYLRQFPLDFLKIDRSLVHQLLRGGAEHVAMVTAIIGLAHALGLWVVAEGVETAEELQTLTRLGCDQAQGFLFGTAEDPAAVAPLVTLRAALSAGTGVSGAAAHRPAREPG